MKYSVKGANRRLTDFAGAQAVNCVSDIVLVAALGGEGLWQIFAFLHTALNEGGIFKIQQLMLIGGT